MLGPARTRLIRVVLASADGAGHDVESRQLLDPRDLHDFLYRIVNAVQDDVQSSGAALAAATITLIPLESMNRSCLMSTVTGPPEPSTWSNAAANSCSFAMSSSPWRMKP